MKIALLGNMNNNNFSLLRYLRDFGMDAHLLLYKSDGTGYSDHFAVESDTFEIEKWKPYIHQTNISDNIVCAFNFPLSWLLSLRLYIRSIFNKQLQYIFPVSKKYLKNLLKNYTHLIGSGITPAMLNRINKKLTIFFPHSIGVEYYNSFVINSIVNQKNFLAKFFFKTLKRQQKIGIQNSKFIINMERSLTEIALKEIGVKSEPIFLPLYIKNSFPKILNNKEIDYVDEALQKSFFSIISHARLLWKKPSNYSDNEWIGQNKNNDRLVRAFARLKTRRIELKPLLFLFKYGKDVQPTEELIKELGIDNDVIFLPKMNRKFIYNIISKVDAGVGEFYDIKNLMFGYTAVEIMAMGKPLIQAFDYSEDEFEDSFGTTLPPILPAKTEDEIFNQLLFLSNSNNEKIKLGKLSKIWFDKNLGVEAAKKWFYLIKKK
jgi:hypothetical protein